MYYTHIALCITGASRQVTSVLSVNIVMAFHCSRNKIDFNACFDSEIQHKLLGVCNLFYAVYHCVPKVSVLIFYSNVYWTHLKLQVISFKL
jgi:hypothetical protein